MKEKDICIWEEFGVTEEEFYNIERKVMHADIDSRDYVEFAKKLFPKSKENQIKAFIFWDIGRRYKEKEIEDKLGKINCVFDYIEK